MSERPPSNKLPSHERSRIQREVWLVFAISAVLTAIIVQIGYWIPVIGANSLALVALVFLYLPVIVLRRQKLDPGDFGLDRGLLIRGAKLGALITLVTLFPFLIGFHLWETVVFEQTLDVRLDNYRQWPDQLRFEPLDDHDGLQIRRDQRNLFLEWSGDGPWHFSMHFDGELIQRHGARLHSSSEQDHVWRVDSPNGGQQLVLWARSGTVLEIHASRANAPLAADEIRLGGTTPSEDEVRPIILERTGGWLGLAFLIQFLLVAVPEEFFYRGYLQARLEKVKNKRWKLGPFHTSYAILVTSALFALGHFLVGFEPQRLFVFFPSLAFGWLKDRSGGLGAPIVFHAMCNLMVELTIVHYWPA